MQNIGEAFSHQFKDPKWLEKIFVGGVFVFLSIFIIPTPLLIGYAVRNIRAVMAKEENPLPEWNDLGKMYIEGLKLFLVMMVYSLPIFVIIFFVVLIILSASFLESASLVTLSVLFSFAMYGLIMLYSIILAFVTPVLYIKFANGGSISALFDFKDIFSYVKNNITNILIIILVNYAVGAIAGFSVFFIILIFPVAFYAGTVQSYLYGRLHLEAK